MIFNVLTERCEVMLMNTNRQDLLENYRLMVERSFTFPKNPEVCAGGSINFW
jgi:hypothetical protein